MSFRLPIRLIHELPRHDVILSILSQCQTHDATVENVTPVLSFSCMDCVRSNVEISKKLANEVY